MNPSIKYSNDDLYKCPVHWLENVDGDPNRMRTACGKFSWVCASWRTELLDPNREAVNPVTCQECLKTIADTPIVR